MALKSLLRKLHRDESGDMAQIVLIVAVIVIPLLILLIFFGTDITNYFKQEQNNMVNNRGNISKSANGAKK